MDSEREDDQKEEEVASLPKATIGKIAKETCPDFTFPASTLQMLTECCQEFVRLLTWESNRICEQENKKTLTPDHLLLSLKKLGFISLIEQTKQIYQENLHQKRIQKSSKKSRKLENLGISQEELHQEQLRLIAQSRERQNMK